MCERLFSLDISNLNEWLNSLKNAISFLFQDEISTGLSKAIDDLLKYLDIQELYTQGNSTIVTMESFVNYSTNVTNEISLIKAGVVDITTKLNKSKGLFNEAFSGISNCDNQSECKNLKVSKFVLLKRVLSKSHHVNSNICTHSRCMLPSQYLWSL